MSTAIIVAHHAGLFSLVNNVITCLRIYDDVYVDWRESLYRCPGGGNLWDYLFEPMQMPYGADVVIKEYPDQEITYKHAAKLYVNPDQSWRGELNHIWQRLRVRKEILDEVNKKVKSTPPMVGMLIRADSHAGEQISERSQGLDEYAKEAAKLLMPWEVLYVASSDQASLDWMAERFPVAHSLKTKRSSDRTVDRHLVDAQTEKDAIACLEEVLYLSCCRAFIHPVSNMATAALYINPEMTSIFLP